MGNLVFYIQLALREEGETNSLAYIAAIIENCQVTGQEPLSSNLAQTLTLDPWYMRLTLPLWRLTGPLIHETDSTTVAANRNICEVPVCKLQLVLIFFFCGKNMSLQKSSFSTWFSFVHFSAGKAFTGSPLNIIFHFVVSSWQVHSRI